MEFQIKEISPMLADKVSDEKLELLWDNDDWIAEEKFDGCRYVLNILKQGNKLTSRCKSVKTGKNVDKTFNIPHITAIDYRNLYGTVVDGEITAPGKDFTKVLKIMGSLPEKAIEVQKQIGKAEYWIFDILFYKGKDVQNLEWKKRHELMIEVVDEMRKQCKEVMKVLVWTGDEKRSTYERVLSEGGEGVILKNKFAVYEQGERSKNWVKVKKHITDDVVITGYSEANKWYAEPGCKGADGVLYPEGKFTKYFEKGWIGAIKYGKYKGKELVEIGQCSGMSDDIRQELSNDKNKYIGKVFEIGAQFRFKNGGFRHGNFIRLRSDRDAKSCKEE